MLQSFVAIGPYVERCFEALNEHVRKVTGRTDLPWVVTEYNCGAQSKPVVFRFTLANALNIAEFIRVMMQPRHRVAGANLWNFANEMWGIVRGYPHKGEPLRRQPPFYVFKLYKEHFGDTLIEAKVSCGKWHFPGGSGISATDVPDITVNTAKRKDGTVTLMLVNTNFDAEVEATIIVRGWQKGGSKAEAWSLVGTEPSATNLKGEEVRVRKISIRKAANGWKIILPKHSLTAIEIRP